MYSLNFRLFVCFVSSFKAAVISEREKDIFLQGFLEIFLPDKNKRFTFDLPHNILCVCMIHYEKQNTG